MIHRKRSLFLVLPLALALAVNYSASAFHTPFVGRQPGDKTFSSSLTGMPQGQAAPRPSPNRVPAQPMSPSGSRLVADKVYEEKSFFLRDTTFISETMGWAVGAPHWLTETQIYTGTIIKTVDGGQTWTDQVAPTVEQLNVIDFINSDQGWAVGTGGAIIHTIDGGLHWDTQPVYSQDEFRGVDFIDADHGWATSTKPIHDDSFGEADNWSANIWYTVNGGQTWTQKSTPLESSMSILNRVKFADPLHGWIAGVKFTGNDQFGDPQHRMAIYATSDGGQTWFEQYSPDLNISLTSVDFVDANHGWAAGFPTESDLEGGFIFHTIDGGQTWQRQEAGGFFDPLWDIEFIDANRGYAVGFNYIAAWGPPVYRTLDGGQTWEKIRMQRHDSEGIYGVAVLPNRVVGVGDYDYRVLSTDPWAVLPAGEDSATLFNQVYLNVHYTFQDIRFTDAQHGWVAGSRSFIPEIWGQVIFNTLDGGQHWNTQYTGVPDLSSLFQYNYRLDALYFIDDLNGWAVGGSENLHNAILHTIDGGQTWQEQGTELYTSWDLEFFDVQFLDSQNGWALAASNYPNPNISLAHTTDGGAHWSWVDTGIAKTIQIGFMPVQGGLAFSDAENGLVTGGLGVIARTTDGGVQWTDQSLTSSTNLGNAALIDPSKGFVSGEGLYSTVDSGAHWTLLPMGARYRIDDIRFIDQNNGCLVGGRGEIACTQDGGSRWTWGLNQVSAMNLLGLWMIDPQTVWAAGEAGTILTTHSSHWWQLYLPVTVGP